MYSLQIKTSLGPLSLTASDRGLTHVNFGLEAAPGPSSPLLIDAVQQIQDWLAGKRADFDLPLDIQGTLFQKSVWQQLQAIPRGHFRTYGEIALALNKPGAARAVGGACGANPLLLIIPCHRVLAADGRLGGFSSGLELKRKLLDLEGITWS